MTAAMGIGPDTPVTIGLVQIVAAAIIVVTAGLASLATFYLLLTRKIDEVKQTVVADMDGVRTAVHAVEKDLAEFKATAALSFMSKQSAGAALDRLSTAIDTLRREEAQGRHDLGDRIQATIDKGDEDMREDIRELRRRVDDLSGRLGLPPAR